MALSANAFQSSNNLCLFTLGLDVLFHNKTVYFGENRVKFKISDR